MVTVTVDCESADTNSRGEPDRYSDVFHLDLRVVKAGTWVESSRAPEAQLQKGVAALNTIAGRLKASKL